MHMPDSGIRPAGLNAETDPFIAALSAWLRDLSVEAKIAYHRGALERLRQQQHDDLRAIIALVVGSGHCFSAQELWAHRQVSSDLKSLLFNLGIRNAQQLGKRLKQLGLTRVGEDNAGVVWML